ncbi:hypothetical protein [Serratia silvae]|nr:hypothetical protein [Serratia silvae]
MTKLLDRRHSLTELNGALVGSASHESHLVVIGHQPEEMALATPR